MSLATSILRKCGSVFASHRTLETAAVWIGHRFPRTKLSRSLCFHTGQALMRKGTQAGALDRQARILGGLAKLNLTLGEPSWRETYFHGLQEPEVTHVLQKLAFAGETWLDVGANLGYFTLILAKKVGEGGHVFAFEPNPPVAELLMASLRANSTSNVTLCVHAASESDGEATLSMPVIDSAGVVETGRASLVVDHGGARTQNQRVKTFRLDDFLRDRGILSFRGMKIDVEGAELLVFRGMSRILSESPPDFIVSEVTHTPGAAATAEGLVDHLRGFGYLPFSLRAEGALPLASGERLDPSHDKDVLFVKPPSLALARARLGAYLKAPS